MNNVTGEDVSFKRLLATNNDFFLFVGKVCTPNITYFELFISPQKEFQWIKAHFSQSTRHTLSNFVFEVLA